MVTWLWRKPNGELVVIREGDRSDASVKITPKDEGWFFISIAWRPYAPMSWSEYWSKYDVREASPEMRWAYQQWILSAPIRWVRRLFRRLAAR